MNLPDPDPISTEVFRHLFISVAEEMGVTLERTAYSPNIKERRDHSCALFDHEGGLMAQAAHIPVHLGAFPLLMREVVPLFRWRPGDVVICNDPYRGGTHLPDISLISPVFTRARHLAGFVANRAHHADVGGAFAGSMGPGTELHQEGLVIPPLHLHRAGEPNRELLALLLRNVRTPAEREGDLAAQLAANATGRRRFEELLERYGLAEVRRRVRFARRRSEAAMRSLISRMPDGEFSFEDSLEGDGAGAGPIPIRLTLRISGEKLAADFTGSAPQQKGCVNATLAVTHSAVYYALICLVDAGVSVNEGLFAPVTITAPPASVVNAAAPAAVAAGNVETSQRLVDVVFGALAEALPDRIPAASQGTMNNISLGGVDPETGLPWAYYETLGGGSGASPQAGGTSAIHCHMSNTRNTPAEALEYHYPLRVRRYELRSGSGGAGLHSGGEGVRRELELLGPAQVSLLTERRGAAPYGLRGGQPGTPGRNSLRSGDQELRLPSKGTQQVPEGAALVVETPGGGGWGSPEGEGG